MDDIQAKLIEIVGTQNVSNKDKDLNAYYGRYSGNFLIKTPIKPKFIIKAKKLEQVQQILKVANENNLSVIPISSTAMDANGADAPHTDKVVILDLSEMNEVIIVDTKNRMCMIEPGVTFKQLIPVAKENGLRLLMPLLPSCGKSVVTAALEREPITIPRYHWDASDPLLCTEVVFGTGDLFRTGAAAGPGTIEEQRASGQAQKNPLGPTQFDPFRIIQGAQGSIGVVTWISLKCELLPDTRKILYVQSENLQDLIEFQYTLLKRRLGDELFILNDLDLASLLHKSHESIDKTRKGLKPWTLIIGLAGRGVFGSDKLEFLEGELKDIANAQGIQLLDEIKNISSAELSDIFESCTEKPWRTRYLGASQDVFFITTVDKTPGFIDEVKKMAKSKQFPMENIGVYIQPLVQGCNCHCEFNIYYDPSDGQAKQSARGFFEDLSIALMEKGAFFSRPYGLWADEMYKRVSPDIVTTLQKVKSIFDPKNILNRGALCFKEEGA